MGSLLQVVIVIQHIKNIKFYDIDNLLSHRTSSIFAVENVKMLIKTRPKKQKKLINNHLWFYVNKRLVSLNPNSCAFTAGQGFPGLHLQRAALRHRGDEPGDSPHLRRKQECHGETKEGYCSL